MSITYSWTYPFAIISARILYFFIIQLLFWQWLIDCYQGQDETAISLARVNVQIVITAYKEATNKCNLFEPKQLLSLLLQLQMGYMMICDEE